MGSHHRLLALAAPVAIALQTACAPPVAPPRPPVVASPPAPTVPPVAKIASDPAPLLVAADTGKPRTKDAVVVELQALEQLATASQAGSPEQPHIYRRLAESYVELESAALRDQIDRETRADAAQKARPAEAAQLRIEASHSAQIVAAARLHAIEYYQLLATRYPTFCVRPGVQCGDEVLYFLAHEHEQDHHGEEVRRFYQQLIKSFPQSKYIPNAYVAFGELLFAGAQSDPSRFAMAEQAYRKATEIPPPENAVWGYAHYKLAYVYWNQGDFPRALAEFQRVIEFGTEFASLPNAEKLGAMARKDIVAVYTSTGDPGKAFDFFKPLSGDLAGESSGTLAMSIEAGKSYFDTGHYRECVLLDLDLLRRAPTGPSCAPIAQLDQATARLAPADVVALRAALDRSKKLIDQAHARCPDAAPDPSGAIHKCAPNDPCGGL
jgi:tetratricopeptide (TPR) repeat protein